MESVADRLTVGDPLGCPRMLRGDTSQNVEVTENRNSAHAPEINARSLRILA